MKQSKNKDPEIVLLNSEGPVLKAKGSDDGSYVLYDTDDSIVEILNLDGFIGFIFGNKPVKYTDGREFIFNKFSVGMRTKKADIIKFIILSEKNSAGLDPWISPVAEEREWQEDVLNELFPSYPVGAPRWQYMNGLLQIALIYKEQIEVDHGNSFDDEELEDDENG